MILQYISHQSVVPHHCKIVTLCYDITFKGRGPILMVIDKQSCFFRQIGIYEICNWDICNIYDHYYATVYIIHSLTHLHRRVVRNVSAYTTHGMILSEDPIYALFHR